MQRLKEKFNDAKQAVNKFKPYFFLKKNIPNYAVGVVASFAETALDLLTPYVFSQAIISLEEGKPVSVGNMEFAPFAVVSLFAGIWTLDCLAGNIRTLSLDPIGARASQELIVRYTDSLMCQSLAYHSTYPIADHLGRVYECYISSATLSSQMIGVIAPTMFKLTVAFAFFSKWYGPEMSGTLLAWVIANLVYDLMTRGALTKLTEESLQKDMECYEALFKTISIHELTHQFNNWSQDKKNIFKAIQDNATSTIALAKGLSKNSLGQTIISGCGFTGVSLLIAAGVRDGKYSADDYTYAISFLAALSGPFLSLGNAFNQFLVSLIDLGEIFHELENQIEIQDKYPDVELVVDRNTAKIEFRNVTFQYHNGIKILDDVSFIINPGERVGIVGESGAGKSTIVKLLFRFYEPMSGQILINDQDISKVSLNSLRKALGIVPQIPTVFNDSIYNNIAYGGLSRNTPPTEDEINSVIETACMSSIVNKLPGKANFRVGEKGSKISGGLRQRITIARCLLKNAEINIFDEATSALDVRMEDKVQRNLDQASEGITTITFTHKIHALRNSDKIIVIENGKVAAIGSHYDLLSETNLYKELWNMQLYFFEQTSDDLPEVKEYDEIQSIEEDLSSEVSHINIYPPNTPLNAIKEVRIHVMDSKPERDNVSVKTDDNTPSQELSVSEIQESSRQEHLCITITDVENNKDTFNYAKNKSVTLFTKQAKDYLSPSKIVEEHLSTPSKN